MKKFTLLLSAMLFAMMSMAATTVTMDFTSQAGLEKLGIAYPVDSTTTKGAFQTELVAGQAYTQEGVSLTATHGSTPTRVWLAASGALDLRHYKTGVLTFAAPAGKVILKVKMGGGNVAGFADAPGGVWTGEAATVALAADASASTIKIKTIEVIYGDAGEDIGGNEGGGTTPPVNPGQTTIEIPAEAQGWNIPAEAIDVLQARAICAALESGATTGTKYYVMGYVKKIHSKHADGVSGYGNAQFYMENVKGANSDEDFLAFQVYGLNGQKITDPNAVAVGDFVVVYGELTNYMGDTYETVGKGAAYIWNSTNSLLGSTTPPTPPVDPGKTTIEIPAEAQGWDIPAEAIDVLQARAICAALESGATTGTKYYVMGYVKKIHSKHADGVSEYGNAQFYMENVKGANSDEDFLAFQVYGLNGEKITDPNVVAEGDFVVVYGELTNYMGNTYETVGKGAAYIWNSTNPLIAGPSNVVNVKDLPYAEAYYDEADNVYEFMLYDIDEVAEELLYPIVIMGVNAKSKTAINGTYEILSAMHAIGIDENDEYEGVISDGVGTLTIKNVDSEGNYSFVGSFVGEDGKTYKLNTVANVYAMDGDTEEEIELKEETETPPTPPVDGAIVFDADVDKGNAGTDSDNAAAYQITKNGVTIDVTSGILGTYNNEAHYRIYKNQTLTITSTVGNIAKIEFTCTANDAEKYGPGCFTVDGEYTYSGAVGTWTGDAASVTFAASANQVRATQIVVTLAGTTDVENVVVGQTPTKIIENGQVLIIRGENIYNILGTQVK